jgi:hypothetical protein
VCALKEAQFYLLFLFLLFFSGEDVQGGTVGHPVETGFKTVI